MTDRHKQHVKALQEMRQVMIEDDNWENLKRFIEAVTAGGMALQVLDEKAFTQQKTGKWKEVYAETDYRNGWIEFTCPECEYQHGLENGQYGWSYGDPIPWKYCPCCGMKVEEGTE